MRTLLPYASRRSFTLVELMVVISILAILSSAVLFALFEVMENAKQARTESQIAKLHEMLMDKWQSYRTRAIRLNGLPAGFPDSAANLAAGRLLAMRDLMRMELPDRITDLANGPITITIANSSGATVNTSLASPSLLRNYRKRAGFTGATPPASWTTAHQGAECLYLIIASMRDGDTSGLDFLKEEEIGDIDGDGMYEILDGWGRPIEFLRWAPGYATLPGPDGAWGDPATDDDGNGTDDDFWERGWPGTDDESEVQPRVGIGVTDPFDPMKRDQRETYRLVPLLYSSGSDKIYDTTSDDNPVLVYVNTTPKDDPYVTLSGGRQLGQPVDVDSDGEFNDIDNITNHLIAAE